MRGLYALCCFIRIMIPGFVLRINEDLQIGHAQSSSLRPGRVFKNVMDEYDGRVAGIRKKDSVAHGAGGAGSSGAHADQGIVCFLQQAIGISSRRRCPGIRFIDAQYPRRL
jgi:hypothetical protein